jgi:hypothetical protein
MAFSRRAFSQTTLTALSAATMAGCTTQFTRTCCTKLEIPK